MRTANSEHAPIRAASAEHQKTTARTPLPVKWRLGAGAGLFGVEGAIGYLYPLLGVILAIIDVVIPSAVALILLLAILRGSDKTCERVFRLLRWVANRPEPPAPHAG